MNIKDIKQKLEPVMKIIDQLDSQAVLAVSGVCVLLTLMFGGFADVIALIIGVVIGFAIYKKFLK